MLNDFKTFLLRGNVVDLAIAVVIGAAFKSIIDAFVADFVTPLPWHGGHGDGVTCNWPMPWHVAHGSCRRTVTTRWPPRIASSNVSVIA